jgi:chromosome segregation protein
MEDVIFGGTEKRGAMGFAQVTLILDNSARVLQLDADEVSISRRYYRSGDSEYYINREQVRLRDVTELLMDTGLGADGYSIIGQGRISEIVSAKSTDRREIFEEAAGISRFRHRKDDSERKLARTEENLLRIGDKISELELQVGPLKQQSETAKKYLVLRDELRVQEVSLWMANLDRLRDQSELLRADCEKAQRDCAAARADQERLYAESERLAERMRRLDVEAEERREVLRGHEAAAARTDSESAVLRTNLANNEETLLRLRREMGEQSDRTRSLKNQVAEHKSRIDAINAQREALSEELSELHRRDEENTAGMDEQNKRLSAMLSRENELTAAAAEYKATLSMLEENDRAAAERAEKAAAERAAAEEKNAAAAAELLAAREKLAQARERNDSLVNVIAGHTLRMSSREKAAAELAEQQTRLTVELRSCESRIGLLTELEKNMEGFARATKVVMQEAQRGLLRGVHGPVGQVIRTEDKYALAVETALGAAVGHIIVDTQDDGKAAIELLKKRDGVRTTFRPIDTMKPARLNGEPKGEQGYIGVCADLADTDGRFKGVIANLLGRTAVAETLSDAVAIARRHNNSFRIVTLDGQLLNAGGSMTGGSAGKNTGILSRANELKRLRAQREKLAGDLKNTADRRTAAERELESARYELETARDEQSGTAREAARLEGMENQARLLFDASEEALSALDEEQQAAAVRKKENQQRSAQLREQLAAAEEELSRLEKALAAHSADAEELTARRKALEERFGSVRERIASLDAEKNTVYMAVEQLNGLISQLESDEAQHRDAVQTVQAQTEELSARLTETAARRENLETLITGEKENISNLNGRRLELEGRRSVADKAAQEKNRELLDLERNSALLEQKKLAADMEEKQLVDKLWDSYELSRSEAETVRQTVESLPQTSRRVAELRRSMSALGTPNLGAIEEYKRVSERYEFLSGQRDDVEKSRAEILKIIAEITGQMEDIFRREIQLIDKAFREIFVELFGGGRASVALEDENDVLNCGIDIRIQPPGKAVSNISLLSGGEKAFVAIALYFAIIRVRPTPFCVMDEIESALDEENVARFAEYMRRMCEKTQFIAITHRRGTMEEADQLYGVTMQEKGVSTILAMDMDEALKTIR